MDYIPKIEGERLFLSPMRVEDAPLYIKWLSDPAVSDGLGATTRVHSLEDERSWIEKNAGNYQFAIVRREDGALLGNGGIQNHNVLHQSAEVGLFIGEAENRGKGYGTEALGMLLRYGFVSLNLHSVFLRVFSFNEQAMACYRKAGFREIGRRRQSYYCNGRFWDEVFMDILKEEYESANRA